MNETELLSMRAEKEAKQMRLSKLFFVLAIVFGLIMIFLEPPFVCPDENAHFINICRISRGGLFVDMQDGKPGSYVSDEEFDFLANYAKYNGQGNTTRFDYATMRELSLREPSDHLVFMQTHLSAINPTAYILPAFAVALTRLFTGPVNAYGILLISKIVNLLFYATVLRLAIRKAGAFSNTIFLLGLMPMAIFQGASTSYDAYLIPAAFLLFAYVTKILKSEDVLSREDIVAVAFACACLFGVKIAYAPLVLILLAIPIKKFGSWKRFGVCVGVVAAVGVVFYLIPAVITAQITQGSASVLTELQLEQEALFYSDIWHFPTVISRTVQHFGAYWIESFVGILGWLDTYFPTPFIALFLLISTFNALMDACDTPNIRYNARLLSLLGVAIFFVGTLYTMYVRWNPELVGIVGGDLAYGGQGRYFIPVSLFVLLAASNPLLSYIPFREKLERFRGKLIELTAFCSLSLTVVLLTVRYWA